MTTFVRTEERRNFADHLIAPQQFCERQWSIIFSPLDRTSSSFLQLAWRIVKVVALILPTLIAYLIGGFGHIAKALTPIEKAAQTSPPRSPPPQRVPSPPLPPTQPVEPAAILDAVPSTASPPVRFENGGGELAHNLCFINAVFQVLLYNQELLHLFITNLTHLQDTLPKPREDGAGAGAAFIETDAEKFKRSTLEKLLKLCNDVLAYISNPQQARESISKKPLSSLLTKDGRCNLFPVREFLSAWVNTTITDLPEEHPDIPEYYSYPQSDATDALSQLLFYLNDFAFGPRWTRYETFRCLDKEVVFDDPRAIATASDRYFEGSPFTLEKKGSLTELKPLFSLSTTAMRRSLSFMALLDAHFSISTPLLEVNVTQVKSTFASSAQLPEGTVLAHSGPREEDPINLYQRVEEKEVLDDMPKTLLISLNRANFVRGAVTKDTRLIPDIPVTFQSKAEWSTLKAQYTYKLQSFIVHLGGASDGSSSTNQTNGHYIAYVKKEGVWWEANDTDLKHLGTDDACIQKVLRTTTGVFYVYIAKEDPFTKDAD